MKRIAALLVTLLGSFAASAEMISIAGGSLSAGGALSGGVCPCVRFTFQGTLPGGVLKTEDLWVSVPFLAKATQVEQPGLRQYGSQLFQLAPVDLLKAGGKWGVSFSGVEWGNDIDHGVTDLYRTAASFLYQRLLSETAQLQFRSGAQVESFQFNESNPLLRTTLLSDVRAVWQTDTWKGQMRGYLGFDSGKYLPVDSPQVGLSWNSQWKVLSESDFALSLGGGVQFDYDPFRELGGMSPYDYKGTLSVEVSYWPEAGVVR